MPLIVALPLLLVTGLLILPESFWKRWDMWHVRVSDGYFGLCTPLFFVELSANGFDCVDRCRWNGYRMGCCPDFSKRGTMEFWRYRIERVFSREYC